MAYQNKYKHGSAKQSGENGHGVVILDPSALVESIDGPKISISLRLIHLLGGDIAAAVFLSQAAYLSTLSQDTEGWFDLKQEGDPNWTAGHLFGKIGSWKALLGLGCDTQKKIRETLKGLGLLEERLRGIPARLQYRVQTGPYLAWLGSAPIPSTTQQLKENMNPKKTGFNRSKGQSSVSGKNGNKATNTSESITSKTQKQDSKVVGDISKDLSSDISSPPPPEPLDRKKTVSNTNKHQESKQGCWGEGWLASELQDLQKLPQPYNQDFPVWVRGLSLVDAQRLLDELLIAFRLPRGDASYPRTPDRLVSFWVGKVLTNKFSPSSDAAAYARARAEASKIEEMSGSQGHHILEVAQHSLDKLFRYVLDEPDWDKYVSAKERHENSSQSGNG